MEPLFDQGVIQQVLRPLMSGKEADVFLVLAHGEQRVAKVYKTAENRSFKHRAAYTEGRKVKNSRQARAMAKRSKYGRAEEEAAWRSAEVDAIYRLRAAGVRVPEPFDFVEGVLVMELVKGPDGEPAPRLVDAKLSRREAEDLFDRCIREVVKMLCAGLVHGDLSDFNVLLDDNGPVIIDFPQAVDAAHNNNARKMLIRDVKNLQSFLSRYAPNLRHKKYGEEMWALYQDGQLMPDTKLTGKHRGSQKKVETMSLLEEIEASQREARERRERLGLPPKRPARKPIQTKGPPPRPIKAAKGAPPAARDEAEPKKRKRRRNRRKKKSDGPQTNLDAALDDLLIIGD